MVLVVGKRTTTTKRGANQRGLWIQLTHEFSEVKGQLAHHQEQTKKTTGLSGALKGPKKRGRAKKKIRTKNPQTFWLKTAYKKKKKRKKLESIFVFVYFLLKNFFSFCSTHKRQKREWDKNRATKLTTTMNPRGRSFIIWSLSN